MHLFRSQQIWLAALTLLIQLSGAAVLTIGLCCEPAGKAASTSMDCCKDAGPGHICPLMKKQMRTGAEDGPTLRSCCSPDLQALNALIGQVGLFAPPATVLFTLDETPAAPAPAVVTPRWLSRVESPPPKA